MNHLPSFLNLQNREAEGENLSSVLVMSYEITASGISYQSEQSQIVSYSL